MKLKKCLFLCVALSMFSLARATDLMQVYQDALQNDPIYKQAEAQYLSSKEALPQARALVLPTITANGTAGPAWQWQHGSGLYVVAPENSLHSQYSYNLQLTQAIFNWSAFAGLSAADNAVKQAAATYAAAAEDLIARTSTAYFNILQAQEVLRATKARVKALASQLSVAKQRYKVGIDPVTSVYQAQAAYDTAYATLISDDNNVTVQNEQLRVITGKIYPFLAPLPYNFPLVNPNPNNIDVWTKVAVEENLTLKAARFGTLSAQEQISAQEGQEAPELNLTGQAGQTFNAYNTGATGSQTDSAATVGLSLTFPVYEGGMLRSKVRQTEAQYQLAAAQMDQSYRQTVAGTRQSFLSVISGISQLEADKQSIKSSAAALDSTEAGYKVGTQTIIDVLDQQKVLYDAQTTYAQDRFSYLNTTIQLKEYTGTLKSDDLNEINRWLVNDPIKAAALDAMMLVREEAINAGQMENAQLPGNIADELGATPKKGKEKNKKHKAKQKSDRLKTDLADAKAGFTAPAPTLSAPQLPIAPPPSNVNNGINTLAVPATAPAPAASSPSANTMPGSNTKA